MPKNPGTRPKTASRKRLKIHRFSLSAWPPRTQVKPICAFEREKPGAQQRMRRQVEVRDRPQIDENELEIRLIQQRLEQRVRALAQPGHGNTGR